MDTAEMIEERKLRQGFILATLISTVAGTFITGINLYDRLVEQRRQKKLDRGQNKKIKELEQRLNEAEEEKKKIRENRQETQGNDKNNNLRGVFEQSGSAVQREYDRYYENMGPRFAQGDLIAQTQLQGQIILLQGSVIKILEEALFTGKTPDISKLYNTSEFAREGSIRALRDQYQRLLQAAPPQRRPTAPLRRTSSTPSLRDYATSSVWSDHPPSKKTLTYNQGGRLFCRCAEELQRTNRSLDSCIVRDGSASLCGACGTEVGGEGADGPQSWRIEKEVVSRYSDDGSEAITARSYLLTRRFIFKCHRDGSGYACFLCFCNRDRDTLCKLEEGLVGHITSRHTAREYEKDRDIRELSRPLPR